MSHSRHYSWLDKSIMQFEQAVNTLSSVATGNTRGYPAAEITVEVQDDAQRKLSARLMRVNHAGEISAQALYQGQALSARDPKIKNNLLQAAAEENDHLRWCQQRLQELDSHPSVLNPCWYLGSFCIGALAGLVGDGWSLGFLLETERQVVAHLEAHLQRVADQDPKTTAILQQMQMDEDQHATVALQAGAYELPAVVKLLMKGVSKVMTGTAFWV